MARRRGPALANSLNLASQLILNRQEQQRDRRQKAMEMRAKFIIEMAEKEFERTGTTIDPFTGEQIGTPFESFDPSGLGPGERATVPIPGGGNRTLLGPQTVKPPTEAEARRLSLGMTPGQPLPLTPTQRFTTQPAVGDIPAARIQLGLGGGLPTTPGGGALIQEGITGGLTESPGAQLLKAPPQPQARGGIMDLIRQFAQQGASPFLGTLGQAPGALGGIDPQTQSVIEDLQSGRATPEEFLAQEDELRARGVDVEAVRRELGI